MHAQQQSRVRPHGLAIVIKVGAIGRADFHQACAALAQHVGDAEATADLDELAARDDDLAALGQRRQRQEHGSGIVIHDQGGFGSRQAAEQVLGMQITRPPLPGLQVIFEVAIAGSDTRHGLAGRDVLSGARPRLVWMITPVALITG